MGPRQDAITELRDLADQAQADLELARAAEGWSAVASLHNARRQILKQLIDLLPEDPDEQVEEMSDEELGEAMAAGILELPDAAIKQVERALRERKRNGLRLVG